MYKFSSVRNLVSARQKTCLCRQAGVGYAAHSRGFLTCLSRQAGEVEAKFCLK